MFSGGWYVVCLVGVFLVIIVFIIVLLSRMYVTTFTTTATITIITNTVFNILCYSVFRLCHVAKRVLPAPIKKARKESKRFVDQDYPSDEETALSKVLADMSPTTAANTAANPGMLKNNSCSPEELHSL